jgi:EAL domain-containing protein (putative c-di-GMP-specific phosphodiesterase class I)
MGAEALLRWPHPERGDVPMAETVALADGAGLTSRLGQWVLDQACWQAKSWREAMGISRRNALPFVSVNASVRELLDGNYPDRVASTLSRSGLPPAALAIEISESALMQDPESTITALVRLKALGVRLTIDEFGTGYSSLSHLARFPLDTAKIDRSFVAATPFNHDWTVARSIMHLARSMKLEVVAEGIEQMDEAAAMLALGADYGQGTHLAPAATGDAIQQVLMAGAILRGSAPRARPTGTPLVEAVAGSSRLD